MNTSDSIGLLAKLNGFLLFVISSILPLSVCCGQEMKVLAKWEKESGSMQLLMDDVRTDWPGKGPPDIHLRFSNDKGFSDYAQSSGKILGIMLEGLALAGDSTSKEIQDTLSLRFKGRGGGTILISEMPEMRISIELTRKEALELCSKLYGYFNDLANHQEKAILEPQKKRIEKDTAPFEYSGVLRSGEQRADAIRASLAEKLWLAQEKGPIKPGRPSDKNVKYLLVLTQFGEGVEVHHSIVELNKEGDILNIGNLAQEERKFFKEALAPSLEKSE